MPKYIAYFQVTIDVIADDAEKAFIEAEEALHYLDPVESLELVRLLNQETMEEETPE